MNNDRADRQSPRETEHSSQESEPTLFRAVLSFLSVVALVVVLFFVGGPIRWFGKPATTNQPTMTGTYLLAGEHSAAATGPARFATADCGLRFLDGDRVEIRMHGGYRDGYYRVNRDHLFVETADARRENLSLVFKVDGDRLIGAGIVLERETR